MKRVVPFWLSMTLIKPWGQAWYRSPTAATAPEMLRRLVHLPILAVQFAIVGSQGREVEARCQMPSGNPAWNAALPEGMAVQATVAAYGTVRPTSLPHSRSGSRQFLKRLRHVLVYLESSRELGRREHTD